MTEITVTEADIKAASDYEELGFQDDGEEYSFDEFKEKRFNELAEAFARRAAEAVEAERERIIGAIAAYKDSYEPDDFAQRTAGYALSDVFRILAAFSAGSHRAEMQTADEPSTADCKLNRIIADINAKDRA